MNIRKIQNFTFLIIVLLAFGCSKEPLSETDLIRMGEYEDNYVVVSTNTNLVENNESVVEVGPDYILLSKSDSLAKVSQPGQYLAKTLWNGIDDVTFMRKIITKIDEGNTYRFITESASIDQIFTSINYDSRKDENGIVLVRTDFPIPLKIEAKSLKFNPTVFIEKLGPDFDLDFTYNIDSSYLNITYDSVTEQRIQYDIRIKDIQISGYSCATIKGKARLGYKNDKLIPAPALLMPFPAVGMAIWIDPVFESYLGVKGYLKSSRLDISSEPFDLVFSVGERETTDIEDIFQPAPSFTRTWTPPEFGGKMTGDVFGGYNIYLSTITPARATHIAKLGVKTGIYASATFGKNNTFIPSDSGYEFNFSSGASAKLVASFSLFETQVLGNLVKIGAEWSSETVKHEIWQTSETFGTVCDKITNIEFDQNLTNLTLDVTASSANPNDRYVVFLNDSILTTSTDNPQYFTYNEPHTFQLHVPPIVTNTIEILDTAENQCYFSNIFSIEGALSPSNCSADMKFTDPRNDWDYCTVNFGGKVWMRSNLVYPGDDGTSGKLFDGTSTIFSYYFGRLYTHDEVLAGDSPNPHGSTANIQGICPDGWHLPTIEEFQDMVANVQQQNGVFGSGLVGQLLKFPDPAFWPNASLPDQGYFWAVAAGEYYPWLDDFGHQFNKTLFWTSSMSQDVLGGPHPIAFEINNSDNANLLGNAVTSSRDVGYSCRCIQD